MIVAVVLLALIAVFAAADRAAARYAAGRIAQQIQAHGFPARPHVTVEGFPFLTQLASRDLTGVVVTADGVTAGPVTADVRATASHIILDGGFTGGAISRIHATGLIPFASIATALQAAGTGRLGLTRAGPHLVRVATSLPGVAATARIGQDGSGAIGVHVVSAPGVPAAVLGRLASFRIPLPTLPLGLSIKSVTVTSQGVLVGGSGRNVAFGH